MNTKAKTAIGSIVIDESVARSILPHRAAGAHKWSVGGVIIVGGSPGYIGAPALAALGANRSGAGIVLIASPRGAVGSIASIVPEAAFVPMPDGDLGGGGRRGSEKISEQLDKAKALVVGPGLGDDEYADQLMTALLGRKVAHNTTSLGFSSGKAEELSIGSNSEAILGQTKPAVIDADALN